MQVIKYPYKSLDDVLRQIKKLALKDINFCKKLVNGNDLVSIFYGLKDKIKYKNDPHMIELIQKPSTLLSKYNYHGRSGRGDCDCFTTLGISTLLAKGIKPKDINIVLVGKNPQYPKHIYLEAKNTTFDLTNPILGQERQYKYIQKININSI
jgi:hypothetical protein